MDNVIAAFGAWVTSGTPLFLDSETTEKLFGIRQ
jgi:hypothetical protein